MKSTVSRRQFLSTATKASLAASLIPVSSWASDEIIPDPASRELLAKNTNKLSIYSPDVKLGSIYTPHPAVKPVLKYNHDVDIVKLDRKSVV